MRLSVVIPYHNSEPWIGKMLDSLLDQDLPRDSYEIIAIDDGSTEEPVTLKEYAEKYPNIHYFRQENSGPSVARNHGVRLAKGEWVYFCDSDDLVQPRALGAMLDVGDRTEAEVMFCNVVRVEPGEPLPAPRLNYSGVSGPVTGCEYVVSLPSALTVGPPSYLIRRNVIISNGLLFRDNIIYVEDRMFMMDWLPIVKRVIHVDVDLYYYIQRPTSIMHEQKERQYDRYADYMAICQEQLLAMSNNPDYPEDFRLEMRTWLDTTACTLLLNMCKYSSTDTTVKHLDRLSALGAYPVQVRGTARARRVRRLINHRRSWLIFCSFYRLLPASLRRRILH